MGSVHACLRRVTAERVKLLSAFGLSHAVQTFLLAYTTWELLGCFLMHLICSVTWCIVRVIHKVVLFFCSLFQYFFSIPTYSIERNLS
jgi:hypothetical protein